MGNEDIRKILVVSWMTKYCQNTIHYAVSLAEKYNAELSVIHVIDTLWLQGWNLPTMSQEESLAKEKKMVNAELDKVIGKEAMRSVKTKKIVREGDSTEEILKVIEKEKIDLLVLRAHEESRIERLLVGGSNDALIRKVPCSILLVKCDLEAETALV